MGSGAGGSGKAGVSAGAASGSSRTYLPSALFLIGLLVLTAAFLVGAPQARADLTTFMAPQFNIDAGQWPLCDVYVYNDDPAGDPALAGHHDIK